MNFKLITGIYMDIYKVIIIGSGPAGYTAAIYASRANLKPVVIDGPQAGGQLTTTTVVENYPGFPHGVDANLLVGNMREQALNLGAVFMGGTVVRAELGGDVKRLWLDGGDVVEGYSVIIATGATAKYLGLADEVRFRGLGVSACATCDGFFYRGKDVAVVGGGDTACEEALYLSQMCRRVYMVVRKPYLRASKAMALRVERTANIVVLYEHNTVGLTGDDLRGLDGADLVLRKGEADEKAVHIDIDGFFLAIGHSPNSAVFSEYVDLDADGYIVTLDGSSATRTPGVFAAGDVADPRYRQAITAAAGGCRAALDAERFLSILSMTGA